MLIVKGPSNKRKTTEEFIKNYTYQISFSFSLALGFPILLFSYCFLYLCLQQHLSTLQDTKWKGGKISLYPTN